MGYLREQIAGRLSQDERLCDEALRALTDAVAGDGGMRFGAGAPDCAGTAIYDYFKIDRPKDLGGDARLGALAALPHRPVRLVGHWRAGGLAPLLAFTKDGAAVALLPCLRGYAAYSEGGARKHIRKRDAADFLPDAYAFYRPLPDSVATGSDLLKHAAGRLRPSDMLPLALAALLATAAGMMAPHLVRALLSGWTADGARAAVIALILAALGHSLSRWLGDLYSGRIATRLSMEMESALLLRLLRLPTSFFRTRDTAVLTQCVTRTRTLCTLLIRTLFGAAVGLPLCAASYGQIARHAPGLLLPALIPTLGTLAFCIWTYRAHRIASARLSEASAREDALSYALLRGIMKLRVAGAQRRALGLWIKNHAETAKIRARAPIPVRLGSIAPVCMMLIGMLLLFAAARDAAVSPPDLLASFVSFGLIAAGFGAQCEAAATAGTVAGNTAALTSILAVPVEASDTRPRDLLAMRGGVELSRVTFRYGADLPTVLDDVSVKIAPGSYVALVGGSGSGKSTLLRLLLGFEKPQKGAIYYDRHDLSKVDPRALHRRVGAVLQGDSLFPGGDIFENLAIDKPDLTEAEAWAALRLAGMEDDVRAMPMGLRTLVPERAGFSVGQIQRLLIARAVAAKPKVLLLDEATSALDNLTQKQVSDALATLPCTRIVAAHRLSTIAQCDRVLVLDHGRIVEDGSYDGLMAKDGAFAALIRRQQL